MSERSLPQGFRAAGLHCGIKADASRPDLALFVSDVPATAAGVFTTNQVCGAPVKVSRERVPSSAVRAVVVNSGVANAATGQQGLEDARWMTDRVAALLECPGDAVLVCSTGVIGKLLPREKLARGFEKVMPALDTTDAAFLEAARAMMTTDTVPKQSVRHLALPGGAVCVSGAAKGAAMIAPNMATMLAVVMTDALIEASVADDMLRAAVADSFNSITVEGHTSTSDTVLLLANGASGVTLSADGRDRLTAAVNEVCCELAQAIIRDAEGAEHFVTITARGFASHADAREIARTVANDALVKTAVAGNDPNWGRIVSACGRTAVRLTERNLSLHVNGELIFERGTPCPFDAARLSQSMASGEVEIEILSDLGDDAARFWTSDLTQEYVRLNSEYTT